MTKYRCQPLTTDNTTVHPQPWPHLQARAPVAAFAVNFFRQPTAFAAPIPNPTTLGSSGPTFYQYKDKTKTRSKRILVRSRLGPSDAPVSSDRKMSSLLQPPPAPIEGSQRMYDKVASFLQDMFMEDALEWNKFSRDCAHGRLETWVGSRLPKHLNKEVEIGHVLDALGVTDDWYRECNETLSLVIAYGERGERWECPHAVAACRDRAPPKSCHSSHVHEEYCETVRGRNGQGRVGSSKSP
ncbi:hypothetical protein BGY98DRAFT_1102240 [Russula aff. rugulosa BPL654]|nr:hypothetical protein BGY98DRAFT_1102240 [Russula aff. rugulosa BPL654]